MNRGVIVVLLLAWAGTASAQLFPVRDAGEAPDRTCDVVHYRIQVELDEVARSVRGSVTVTMVPFRPGLTDVELDAEGLNISAVTLGKNLPLRYDILPKKLRIMLDKPYSLADTLRMTIAYNATPARGLYFVRPDSGYPDKPWQIWSQGEDMDNHFWFPCYDFPNDFATSEVIATVNGKFTVVSNGRLLRQTEDRQRGTKTFHWSQSKPHASYLIMVAAGEYTVLRERAESVPLEYYVYPWHVDDARVCFRETPAILKFMNDATGMPYPWEKYAQVVLRDYMYGGMENTSATTLLDEIAVFDARARQDESPTSLIAHELAHQWWGNVVTAMDWRHLWLNEGFASYYDNLYTEHSLGRDEFLYSMQQNHAAALGSDRAVGRRPIVSIGSHGANLYSRGAAVLHMLRYILGDQLYRRAVRYYIAKHRHTPVETNDFKQAIAEATGYNLHWFFDQWVYKAGYPEFDVSFTWIDTSRTLALRVRQTQEMDSLTGVFRVPLDVEVWGAGGRTTHRVEVRSADTVMALPCDEPPANVVFDPGQWVLKKAVFRKPVEMWARQLEGASDAVDRLHALRQLQSSDTSGRYLPLVARRAREDPFRVVRERALMALGGMAGTDSVRKAVARETAFGALSDPRSNVRNAAVNLLGSVRGPGASEALRRALQDSSYAVVSSALGRLARVDSAYATDELVRHLDMPSHRNSVAMAALYGLAYADTARAYAESKRRVAYGNPVWVRYASLQMIKRYGKQQPDAIALVSGLTDDPDRTIRPTAVSALGEIGDASALPTLEAIAADPKNAAAEEAQRSITSINERLSQHTP